MIKLSSFTSAGSHCSDVFALFPTFPAKKRPQYRPPFLEAAELYFINQNSFYSIETNISNKLYVFPKCVFLLYRFMLKKVVNDALS